MTTKTLLKLTTLAGLLAWALPARASKFSDLQVFPSSASYFIGYPNSAGSLVPAGGRDTVLTSSGAAVVQSTSATSAHKPFRVKNNAGSDILSVTQGGEANVKILNAVRYADQFPGADASAQIIACLADIPSTGGTCDARGLPVVQTWASNIFGGLPVTSHVTLLLGPGIVTVSSAQIVTSNYLTVRGPGSHLLEIKAGIAGTLLTLGTAADVVQHSIFSGFILDGNSNTGTDGIKIVNTRYVFLEDIRVNGFSDNGIEAPQGGLYNLYNKFEDVISDGNGGHGFYDAGSIFNAFTVIDSRFSTNGGSGFVFAGVGLNFSGGSLEGNGATAMVLYESNNGTAQGANVSGTYFETSGPATIQIGDSSGRSFDGASFSGNYIQGNAISTSVFVFWNTSGTVITGNNMWGHINQTYLVMGGFIPNVTMVGNAYTSEPTTRIVPSTSTAKMAVFNEDGFTGLGLGVPGATFDVNGAAVFGSGVTKSSFSTTGQLALNSNATLTVGTTFYVGNGRVGIGMVSPTSKLNVETSEVNTYAAILQNVAATGSSDGTKIIAGGDSTDTALLVQNRTETVNGLKVDGAGNTYLNTGGVYASTYTVATGALALPSRLSVGSTAVSNTVSFSSGTGANGLAVFKFGMISLGDDATYALETNFGTGGWLTVQALGNTSNAGCVFYIRADNNQALISSDPSSVCAVADTDAKIAVTSDGDATYTLKNRLGGVENFAIQFVGR